MIRRLTEESVMRTLVAIDGSDCSMKALEFIAHRPWNHDDSFMVLSVVELIPAEIGLGYVPPTATSIDEQLYKECDDITQRAKQKIEHALPGLTVENHVETGPVANTICRYAESWNADLIIVGSHGRRGLSHFFLGSIAEEVLKQSPCSVEIVKSKIESQGH